MSIYWKTDQG